MKLSEQKNSATNTQKETKKMQFRIKLNKDGDQVITEIYSGILLETEGGNQLGVCMRDDTFEINVLPAGVPYDEENWHRVNMATAEIYRASKSFGWQAQTLLNCKGNTKELTHWLYNQDFFVLPTGKPLGKNMVRACLQNAGASDKDIEIIMSVINQEEQEDVKS